MMSVKYNIWYLLFVQLGAILNTQAQLIQSTQDQTVSELEHLYFDDSPAGFFSGLEPCSLYIDSTTALPRNGTGRQTSAQWIRVAFHDFQTADVATGRGGLDASIAFETHHPENVGPAFNDSLFFFQFFFSDRASMADLVALGAVAAVGKCGGPNVPYRGGRVDAIEQGPTGVCLPEDNLKTLLGHFASAGFNQQDTIALTACGHSMGGVHRAQFPNIVPANGGFPIEGSDGRQDFDETPTVFDAGHVHGYLDGTGTRGGPLVTTSNKTVASDLRLFSSDNNQTIKGLAKAPDSFANTCTKLLARMIDTVPNGVSLTPQIQPSDVKPIDLSLGISWNGTTSLSGTIRYMNVAAGPAPESLSIALKGRNGRTSVPAFQATTNLAVDNGTGVFGPTHRYDFTIDYPSTTGLSALVVKGKKFAMQDSIFVVTPLSSVNPGLAAFFDQFKVQPFTFNITVAALLPKPQSSLKATFAIPFPQPGVILPKIDRSNEVQIPSVGKAGQYTIFSTVTTLNLNVVQVFGSSLDIDAVGLPSQVSFYKLNTLLK